jgi:predicted transcriptional regulator
VALTPEVRELIKRQRLAGYPIKDIAKQHGFTRQYIYRITKSETKPKAYINKTDTGFHVTTEDNPAAATAVRLALKNAGWEVEG